MTTLLDDRSVRFDRTFVRFQGWIDTGVAQHARFFVPAQAADARSYDDEKQAFLPMLPSLRGSHPGKHVIIANGVLADSDDSRRALVKRFFGQPSPSPVYIGFVGPRRIVRAPTPIIRRHH